VAAVCFIDGKIFYADMEPEAKVLRQFMPREDNQIASLEMLAVACGSRVI